MHAMTILIAAKAMQAPQIDAAEALVGDVVVVKVPEVGSIF